MTLYDTQNYRSHVCMIPPVLMFINLFLYMYTCCCVQELEFPLQTTQPYFTTLKITVWDHKKITKDVSIGTHNADTKQAYPQLTVCTCQHAVAVYLLSCIVFAGQVSLKTKQFWDKVKSASLLTYEWYTLRELNSVTNV